MYIDKVTNDDLKEYIANCCAYSPEIDFDLAYKNTITYFKQHNGKKHNPNDMFEIHRMFSIWYESLIENPQNPNYSVYDDPYYMLEVWLCWVNYSRRYLKNIQNPKSMFGISIADDMRKSGLNSILDLGCGSGYTTAAFKEIFPTCSVYGTNFETSVQYKMSSDLSKKIGFTMLPNHLSIRNIDLIFASEYFEHILDPIKHLSDIIFTCNPKYFIIANTFTSPAIGHFDYYNHGNTRLEGRKMSLKFNEFLRKLGYERIKTNCWNNRPSYWKRKDFIALETT